MNASESDTDTTQKRRRVGLVGAGSHAVRNILSSVAFLPFDLVAVADTVAERAERAAALTGAEPYTSASDMFTEAGLDAVLLVAGARFHARLAIEAFGRGLDVWTEKPPAVSLDEIDQMIAARGDRVAGVGYKKAVMPAMAKVRELLGHGVRSASATYPNDVPLHLDGPPYPVHTWLSDGCHPLSALLSVGGPVASVSTHRAAESGSALVLHHTNGVVSVLHLTRGAPVYQPSERYLFVGDGVSVAIENGRRVVFQREIPARYDSDDDFTLGGPDSGALVWEAQDTMATMQGKNVVTQGILPSLLAFDRAMTSRRQPEFGSLEFARQVTAVCEAAQASDAVLVPVPAAPEPALAAPAPQGSPSRVTTR